MSKRSTNYRGNKQSKADTEQYVRANQAKYKNKGHGGFALKAQAAFDRHIIAPVVHATGRKLIKSTKHPGGAVSVTGKSRVFTVLKARPNVTVKRAFTATPQHIQAAHKVASKRANLAAKRKNRKSQGVNMGVVFPMVSKGNRSYTKVSLSNDEMILHSRAMVGTIVVGGADLPGKKLLDVLVNPMNVVMCGPREVRMASTMDKSDITHLSFEVVSTRSTSTNGSMHGAHLFDPTEYIPENEDGLRLLTNKVGAHDTTFYNTGNKSMMTWVRPKWPGKKPTFYVDRTGVEEASIRQTDEGRFIIMLGVGYDGDGDPESKTVMGTVWCNMTARFYDPTLQLITGSNDAYSIPYAQTGYVVTYPATTADVAFNFAHPEFLDPNVDTIINGPNNNAGCEPQSTLVGDEFAGAIYLPTGVWNLGGTMGKTCAVTPAGQAVSFTWCIWDGTKTPGTRWRFLNFYEQANETGQQMMKIIKMDAGEDRSVLPMAFPSARVIARPAGDTYVRLTSWNSAGTPAIATLSFSSNATGFDDALGITIQAAEPTAYERAQLIPNLAISEQFNAIRREMAQIREDRDLYLRSLDNETKVEYIDKPHRKEPYLESFKEGKLELVMPRGLPNFEPPVDNDEKSDGESVEDTGLPPLQRTKRRYVGSATGPYVHVNSNQLRGTIEVGGKFTNGTVATPPTRVSSLK